MAEVDRRARFRPDKLAEFLEAVYRLEADEQTWLADMLASARDVWGRSDPCYAAICDASDVNAFQVERMHAIDLSDAAISLLRDAVDFFTPAFVARTLRSVQVSMGRKISMPELRPMYAGLRLLGLRDAFGISGFEPTGPLVYIGFLMAHPVEPPAAETAVYRRIAHHLAAAHRYRRRLRANQRGGQMSDRSEGAEAILDARRRVVHATGPAKAKTAQQALVTASKARDMAHTTKASAQQGLRLWSPLTNARWTLVDSFERDGARFVVARENQVELGGLTLLTDRERQVVAQVAIGASTKEAAYALGITDATVRVLLARASAKLGVKSRSQLLAHPEVATFRPQS